MCNVTLIIFLKRFILMSILLIKAGFFTRKKTVKGQKSSIFSPIGLTIQEFSIHLTVKKKINSKMPFDL